MLQHDDFVEKRFNSLQKQISDKQKKSAVVAIRSGDTIRVHQKIVEGGN